MASKSKAKKSSSRAKSKRRPSTKGGEHSSIQIIGVKDLQYVCRKADQCQAQAASASGEIGGIIQEFQEKKNLHPGGFRLVQRWRKMGANDPVKLRVLLDNLDAYRDMLKIDDMKASDMFLDKQAEDEKETEETGEPPADNVTEFRQAAE